MYLEADLLEEDRRPDVDVEAADARAQEVEVAVLDPEAGADRVLVGEVDDGLRTARPGAALLPVQLDVLQLEG